MYIVVLWLITGLMGLNAVGATFQILSNCYAKTLDILNVIKNRSL